MMTELDLFCENATEFLSRFNQSVDLIYMDPPFKTERNFGAFDDRWPSMNDYVWFMSDMAEFARLALSVNGNFVLHIDPRASHYLKVAIDEIFGIENFRNEVIWSYSSGGASKRTLARKHDVLLWWSKSDNYTFNILREPYATPDVKDRPGFHPDGRMLTDVWQISFLSTTAKERTGYPTQKPLGLLERVIRVWSNEGDLVVDPFCGSGTTGEAAMSLLRNFVGNDSNPEAIEISRQRLNKFIAL